MTTLDRLRRQGRLSLEDEAHILRLDHELLKHASPAARKVLAPVVKEQIGHYEAALAKVQAEA